MNLKTKKLIAALLIATSAGLFTAGCGTDQSAKKAAPENRGRYMDRVTGRKESGYESNSTAEKSCFHVLCHDRNDAYARIAGSDGRHRF